MYIHLIYTHIYIYIYTYTYIHPLGGARPSAAGAGSGEGVVEHEIHHTLLGGRLDQLLLGPPVPHLERESVWERVRWCVCVRERDSV